MRCRPSPSSILVELTRAGIDFILVDGLAAVAQGVPLATLDVDVVHDRTETSVRRLLTLLLRLGGHARGHGPTRRLLPGREALLGPGHQLLQTRLGPLDLLGAIEGGADYAALLPHARAVELRGHTVRVLELAKLADLKRSSTRPKDILTLSLIEQTIAVQEAARQEREETHEEGAAPSRPVRHSLVLTDWVDRSPSLPPPTWSARTSRA